MEPVTRTAHVGLLLSLAVVLGRAQIQCPAEPTYVCSSSYSLTEEPNALSVADEQSYCFVCGSGQINNATWRIDHKEVTPSHGKIMPDGILVIFATECTFNTQSPVQVTCDPSGPDTIKSLLVFLAIFKPPQLPDFYKANTSQSLTLECNTSESTPTFIRDVYWIDPSGETTNAKKFQISSISRSDAGEYTCVVEAKDGATLNASTTVIVQSLPATPSVTRFSTTDEDFSIDEGETLTLLCTAIGEPTPSIALQHDGVNITSNPPKVTISHSGGTSILTISAVKESDGGNYTCVAVNTVGTDSMKLSLQIRPKSKSAPRQSCTSTNEQTASSDPNQHDLVWICQSGSWLPYKITPSTGTTENLAGKSCKHIRNELASNCFKPPQSGAYWIHYTDTCSNETTAMKVWCDMELDGGGWTMVWKHSYMEVPLPLTEDMTYFSDFFKLCTDLEAGWCNVPRKAPTEIMIAAYHNKRVVYAYKGFFNRNLDSHWSGGILLNPYKVIDHCSRSNGIQPAPLSSIAGIAFDKWSPYDYTINCDTYVGSFSAPTDCRWHNCYLPSSISLTHRNTQMTMVIYVR